VPDGVDATVETVKAAGGHAVVDRVLRKAELSKLSRRDRSVLSVRQRRHT
jgi:hypothetical protein